jgi:hypothetical protein
MKLAIIIALTLLGLWPRGLQAETFSWGSAFRSILVQANGQPMDGNFVFELGAFNAGFIPTENNLTLWNQNWRLLDQADSSTSEYVPANGVFGSSASLTTNSNFAVGTQMFIWGHNGKSILPATEWVLLTNGPGETPSNTSDNWTMPRVTSSINSIIYYRVSGATVPVFGGINSTQGPGGYSAAPGTFALQSHWVMSQVPEPGTVALVALGLIGGCVRRQRRR